MKSGSSRNGPAGTQRPVPSNGERVASTTTISNRRGSRQCCRPSSDSTTLTSPIKAAAAASRSRPTTTGQPVCAANHAGSSPTVVTESPGRTRRTFKLARPCPRDTRPTRWPRASSCLASQATTGVLPVPPTVRLPTTTTGGSKRPSTSGLPSMCRTARCRRRRAKAATHQASGISTLAATTLQGTVPGLHHPVFEAATAQQANHASKRIR